MTPVENVLADLFREKTYIYVFDWVDPKCNSTALLTYIKDSRSILSWSYPMAGVYLLKSFDRAIPLSENLRAVAGDVRSLLSEVEVGNMGGWLPGAAWDWFRPAENKEAVPLGRTLFGSIEPPKKK